MDHLPGNHYIRVHIWIRQNYEKTGQCEHCNRSVKTEWSNKSGEYKFERDDWQELCRKCHNTYDHQPHMVGASFRAGARKVDDWHIPDVDLTTRRRVKVYAITHGMNINEAIAYLLDNVGIPRSPQN